MRLTYPSSTTAKVLINTSRSATGNRSGSISISGSTVTGTFTGGGFCGSSKTYQIFFRMEFDRAPTSCRHLDRRHRLQRLDQHQRRQLRRLAQLRHHRATRSSR